MLLILVASLPCVPWQWTRALRTAAVEVLGSQEGQKESPMPVGALEKTPRESCVCNACRGRRFRLSSVNHQLLSIQALPGNAPLAPLDSALTSKRASKSFTSN